MARGVNKVILIEAYQRGMSLTDISHQFGTPVSTARYHIARAGALRDRTTAIRAAAASGKLGRLGASRSFTDSHKANISEARRRHAEKFARGISRKSNGYIQLTRGANKDRGLHVVLMEERIGRRLLKDEVVHHVDGNPSNNHINNLALLTRAGHTRLHRREQRLIGIWRLHND